MTQETIFVEDELVPLIHAAWIDIDPNKHEWDKDGMCYYCSNCKHRAGKYKHKTYKYCPWCGAKMDIPVAYAKTSPYDDRIKVYTFVGEFKRGDG